jgi:ribonuclease P protein component
VKNAMKKTDIELVFSEKKAFATNCFLIRWRKNELKSPRVAFAFSRTAGSAVLRNRFKRRLRALIQTKPACCGLDMVFLTKKPLSQIQETIWKQEALKVARFCEQTH